MIKPNSKNKLNCHEDLTQLIEVGNRKSISKEKVTSEANTMDAILCYHIDKIYKKIDKLTSTVEYIDAYLVGKREFDEYKEFKDKEAKAIKKQKH